MRKPRVKDLLIAALTTGVLSMSFYSSPSWSLGIGEITIYSNLNEPFDAEVELLSVEPNIDLNTILVSLADHNVFEEAGLERIPVLSEIKFKVEQNPSGVKVIRLTSAVAIKEPFLTVMLDVNWPQGHVRKEYTVLLDPPDYGLAVPSRQAVQETKPVTKREKAIASSTAQAPRSTPAANQQEQKPLEILEAPKKGTRPSARLEEIRTREATEKMNHRLALVEEALDSLKLTNDNLLEEQVALREQNESLSDVVKQRDEEIQNLRTYLEAFLSGRPNTKVSLPSISDPQLMSPTAVPPDNTAPVVTPAPVPSANQQAAKTLPVQVAPSASPPLEENLGWYATMKSYLAELGVLLIFLLGGGILWKRRKGSIPFLRSKTDMSFQTSSNAKQDIYPAPQSYPPPSNIEEALAVFEDEEDKKKSKMKGSDIEDRQEKYPSNVDEQLNDIEVYLAFEKFDIAEEAVKKIISHFPDNLTAHLKLIEIYMKTERQAEAKAHIDALSPNLAEKNIPAWEKIQNYASTLSKEGTKEGTPASEEMSFPEVSPEVQMDEIADTETAESVKTNDLPFIDSESEIELKSSPIEEEEDPQAENVLEFIMEDEAEKKKEKTNEVKFDEKTLDEMPFPQGSIEASDESSFQTKLELAKVYSEMGDKDSAKDLLHEILAHGSDDLKAQAQNLLSHLDK